MRDLLKGVIGSLLFPFVKTGFYLQAKNVKIASILIINNIFCYSLTAH